MTDILKKTDQGIFAMFFKEEKTTPNIVGKLSV